MVQVIFKIQTLFMKILLLFVSIVMKQLIICISSVTKISTLNE